MHQYLVEWANCAEVRTPSYAVQRAQQNTDMFKSFRRSG